MNNLDAIDFAQMFGIIGALLTGFLQSIRPVKKADWYGAIIVIGFIISSIATVYSTLAKSSADKDDYIQLANGAESTLKRVNQNIDTSNRIMGISNESIQRLMDIQNKSIELQKGSELLNQKLRDEIEIQKQTNRFANKLLQNNIDEDLRTQAFNRLKLMLSIAEIRNSPANLYESIQKLPKQVDTLIFRIRNYQTEYQRMDDSLRSLNRSISQNDYDNLQNLLTTIDTLDRKISGTYQAKGIVSIRDSGNRVYYKVNDSLAFLSSIRDFLNLNSALLSVHMANPYLTKNKVLFESWQTYYQELIFTKVRFYRQNSFGNRLNLFSKMLLSHDRFCSFLDTIKLDDSKLINLK